MILDCLWYCKALRELTGVQVTPVIPEAITPSEDILKKESLFCLIFFPEISAQTQDLWLFYRKLSFQEIQDLQLNNITRRAVEQSKDVYICDPNGENILGLSQDDIDLLQNIKQQVLNGNFQITPNQTQTNWLKVSIIYLNYKLNNTLDLSQLENIQCDTNLSRTLCYIMYYRILQDSLSRDVGELE